jgi:hypothetical protein
MKFYKRLPISQFNPMDDKFAVEADGRIVTDTVVGMETPSGDASQRSVFPENGTIRYNTDIGNGGELEAYVNGTWEIIKTNRQATVTKQTFENGDYADTIFGPLAYDIDITKPENLSVYVENVYQIPGVNYELRRSSLGFPLTSTATVVQTVGFGETVVYLDTIADFNVGLTLTGTNLNNNVIIATSATDKSITIEPGALGFIPVGGLAVANFSTGTYVQFEPSSTPVPFKPVTTLLGLDGYCPPFQV